MSSTEEGEYSDEDVSDSSSSEQVGFAGVLPVGKFTSKFTPESAPGTGEEYLCLVRHESKSLQTFSSAPSDVSVDSPFSSTLFNTIEPLQVSKEQLEAVRSIYEATEKSNNMVKEAVKGSFQALCTLSPMQLRPAQISDIRTQAKSYLTSSTEEHLNYIILVATVFAQRDLIKLT